MKGVLKWSWKGTKLGAARVFLFWKGGVWTYVGIALVPIWDNWGAISTFLDNVSWRTFSEVLIAVGHSVADSLEVITSAAQQLPSASGSVPVTVLGVEIGVPHVAVLLWSIIVGITTIGWYFRSMHLFTKLLGGDNIPPILSFMIGVFVFAMLVWGATGAFPVGELAAASDAVLQWLDTMHSTGGAGANSSLY